MLLAKIFANSDNQKLKKAGQLFFENRERAESINWAKGKLRELERNEYDHLKMIRKNPDSWFCDKYGNAENPYREAIRKVRVELDNLNLNKESTILKDKEGRYIP